MSLYHLSSYDYRLPEELIAQHPLPERDSSRLMVVNRKTKKIDLFQFRDLVTLLNNSDHLVFNNTKVIPARLKGARDTGGKTEILLLKHLFDDTWEALARPQKKLKKGSVIQIGKNFACEVIELLPKGKVHVAFHYTGNFYATLASFGEIPLPHYIQRTETLAQDQENYQTVYATSPGAAAAPTAGLHFTKGLLKNLGDQGVSKTELTLHVGAGTFRPVQVDDIRDHSMHSEQVIISQETAKELNASKKRIIAVGTTSCRALESASNGEGKIQPGAFETAIFIYPGYQFRFIDALITNFHLPRSTLLMLVSAFGGYELIQKAYQLAVKERFRFYSYGDAMLIV